MRANNDASKRPNCRRCAYAALVTAGTLLATGCRGPVTRVVGLSVEGRPMKCHTLGSGGEVVLILATIHGDEPAGTALARRLRDHLIKHPRLLDNRKVVIVPVANPDGFAHHSRTNLRGVNLNRNFPAPNFTAIADHGPGPLSEPESRAIHSILRDVEPSRIVSIHQPVGCIDYDGPAANLARAMAAWTDLPVRRIGALPGSLGSYAGLQLGIPIITLELPASANRLDENTLWRRYGKTLLAAIRYPDRID